MKRLLIFSSLVFFLFSCGNGGKDNQHLSFQWSPRVDSLLKDTIRDNPEMDSLRKEALNAANDTDAINKANSFSEKLSKNKMVLLTTETEAFSRKINYKYGIISSLYFKSLYQYRKGNYDSTVALADSCHKLAKQNHFVKLQTRCLEKSGDAYYMQDKYDQSFDDFQQALIIATIYKDQHSIAFCLAHIGELYRIQNEYAKALEYYGKAIDLATKIGDKDVISYSTGALGDIYRSQGNFSKALDSYHQALILARKKNDKYEIAYSLSNLGDANRLNKNYPSAIGYYNEALVIFREIDDKVNITYCLSNLANVYQHSGDYTNAIDYAQQAMAYSKQLNDNLSIDDCLSTLGDIYELSGQYDSASFYLNKAIENGTKIGDNGTVSFCRRRIAHMYFQMGKMDEAYKAAQEGMDLAQKSHEVMNIKGSAELLYRIYAKKGDYKNAFDMHLLYTKMYDSLLSNDQTKKFAAVELKSRENELKADQTKKDADYRADKIKKEEEIKRQKTIAYAVTAGLFVVLLLSLVIFRSLQQNKKAKKIIEEQKHLVDEKQKEVMDSIRYAKRIQQSLLPTEIYIDKSLKKLKDKKD